MEVQMNEEEYEIAVTDKSGFLTICKHLMKNSSVYAVSQIGYVASSSRRIWWMFVFIVGLSGCGYQSILFLQQYFEYPVVVNLQLESKLSLNFPAVTICNLNRIKSEFLYCMKHGKAPGECDEHGAIPEGAKEGIAISERLSIRKSCSSQLSGQKDKNADDRLRFLMEYTALTYKDRKMYGCQFQDLIQHCSYNDVPCAEVDFSYFQSLMYGNCFTFNRMNSSNALKASSSSNGKGLDFVLNIDEDSYIELAPSTGARVIVHDPNEDPSPEEDGINISPGFETSVGITQKIVSRLPSPYRDHCIEYEDDESSRGKTRKDCVRICIQEQNWADCSCIDPTFSALHGLRHCDMSNDTEACCLDRVLDSMVFKGLPRECPLPCFSLKYDIKSSTAALTSQPKDPESSEKNMANVKIFYSKFERMLIEQKPMFDTYNLFSNLGSLMSLWLGLSLFALFELIENIADVCFYCFRRRNRAAM